MEQYKELYLKWKESPLCDEETKRELSSIAEDEIEIYIELNIGDAQATAWGCDLTYDYVKINGDYRS